MKYSILFLIFGTVSSNETYMYPNCHNKNEISLYQYSLSSVIVTSHIIIVYNNNSICNRNTVILIHDNKGL